MGAALTSGFQDVLLCLFLLFLWECGSVTLHLRLHVFLQLRVCPELKASALSERIQWILGLPGFSWTL